MRALVTGAAKRVGRAIAIELARTGWHVVIHYRSSAAAAQETADQCRRFGVQADIVQGDLSTLAGCDKVIDWVKSKFESLELLVNNASLFVPRPFADTDAAHFETMINVNLRAPFWLSKGLLPLLRQGTIPGAPDAQRGVVVHLCDVGADRPVRGYTAYSVSKAGLVMLVKSMAIELAPAVRTVGVSPGHVVWPLGSDAATQERLRQRIPLKRVGGAQAIANTVRFVATEAHYINGSIIKVDGGLSTGY